MAATVPGVQLIDHWLRVPLDHADPHGERITVYAREVRAPDGGVDRPWLLFLQGGPGGKSPRPEGPDAWLAPALAHFRVLLLDQRGTGRSTAVTARGLAERGAPPAQAGYLAHFRADAIIRDAELLRRGLAGDQPWSTLGQSYGGFCTLTYLSFAPEGLRECLVTGGLAGLEATAEEVYRRTYPRVVAKNEEYYARYPDDEEAVRAIVDHLAATDTRLPTGERLTPERLQCLGAGFGGTGGYETVHYLVEEAWDGPELSPAFLEGVGHQTSFATRPLYALLQEACYGQGAATRWAAQRVRGEFGEFDASGGGRVLFTGEMMYPWMCEQEPAMRAFAPVAGLLAERTHWPVLYDVGRLAANAVPVAAAVYHDDMYVDAELSMQTARQVRSVRTWVTNEFEHNGLRVAGERVFPRLLDMVRGRA